MSYIECVLLTYASQVDYMRNMICENCKAHIERKFFPQGKTVNCLSYNCERPFTNPGLIECTREEICNYIYELLKNNGKL